MLVLSTRKSRLALWQADAARAALTQAHPGLEVELLPVSSSGDQDLSTALSRFGRIGIFTVEVDAALLDGRAQVGVHSLKDLTTRLEQGLVLGGVLPRGPVDDALVARDGLTLEELPARARVATSSQRRKAQLLAARPDLQVVEIRGNVESRLAKLDAGEADALLMARAGLERLDLDARITEVLDHERFLPAVSQGIVGLTCRADDAATQELLSRLPDDGTLARARAERRFLSTLEAGCTAPLAAHATVDGDSLHLKARVLSLDGTRSLSGARAGSTAEPEALGEALAKDLLAQGAAKLVAEARS
jgi:hydroxymethylbilane synthase